MPGSSAEHSSAKGSSSSQLKSWLSGLGKKGKAEGEEVRLLDSWAYKAWAIPWL